MSDSTQTSLESAVGSVTVDAAGLGAFLEAAPDAIVVVDGSGRIVTVNPLGERMFGYGRDALLGKPVEMLLPERSRPRHEGHRARYFHEPRTRPMGDGLELAGRRCDGSEFAVEISLSPIRTDRGTLVISIVRDITGRRRVAELLQASLREKEVLLKEIHHRVKNNLQVISSLLKLQSAFLEDPRAREVFAESQARIRSMALVHEKLYQSSDLSHIDLADYARGLAEPLFRSFGVDRQRIALELPTGELWVSIEAAVPCGLILNELLTNCLKHAFPGGRAGTIRVRVGREAGGEYLLAVGDNGVGLPAGLEARSATTLGLQLVHTLVEQLHARLEVSREGGTELRVVVL